MRLGFTRNGDSARCKRPIAFSPKAPDCEEVPSTAKILIVDDDAEIRQLLGEELRDLGHDSFYASDGIQALSMVRRERPDLILLDLRLPGGDGFSVLVRLQRIAEVAHIPVIVFSGMRSPDAEETALKLGAREFIQKSLSGNHLAEAIARVLDGPVPDLSQPPLSLQVSP
jgi:DNA-binding response OmpR family regulator